MSGNKKNADTGRWLTCPSNSFPGRFYYFNTASGEAVWSLNDVEHQHKKDLHIQRISKYHNYPEPNTPPEDINFTTINQNQAIFKPTLKCTIDQCHTDNMIWTPVQFTIETNIPVCNMAIDKTVHAGEIPLCKRFKNYNNTSLAFDNSVVNKEGFATSTPKKPSLISEPNIEINKISNTETSVPNSNNFEGGNKVAGIKKSFTNVPLFKTVTPNNCFNLNTVSTSAYNTVVSPKGKSVEDTFTPKSTNFETYALKKNSFGSNMPKKSVWGTSSANLGDSNDSKSASFDTSIPKMANVDYTHKNTNLAVDIAPRHSDYEANIPKTSEWDRNVPTGDNVVSCNEPKSYFDACYGRKIVIIDETRADDEKYRNWEAYAAKNVDPCVHKRSIFDTHAVKSPDHETHAPKSSLFESHAPKSSYQETHLPKSSIFENHAPKKSIVETYGTKKSIYETHAPKSSNSKIQALNHSNFESHATTSAAHETYVPKTSIFGTHAPKSIFERCTPKSSIFESPAKNNEELIQFESKQQDYENFTLEFGNKDEIEKNDLDRYDLRHLIIAKRRKSQSNDCEIDAKKSKHHDSGIPDIQIREKRVRFNIEDSVESNGIQQHTRDKDVEPSSLEDMLIRNNLWYIITDTDLLIDQFDYIEEIVTSDSNCSLLIPYAVELDIKKLSGNECRGLQRITNARCLIRKLPTMSYCTVESPIKIDDIETADSIIKCCLRVINDGYYVVLITNNLKLYNRAKTYSIPCYNLKEIKNGAILKPKYNVKIVLNNNNRLIKEEGYVFSDKMPVHIYKQQQFTDKQTKHVNDIQNIDKFIINSTKIEYTGLDKGKNNCIFNQYDDCTDNTFSSDNNLTAHEIYNNLQEKLPFKNVNNIKKIFNSDQKTDTHPKKFAEKSNIPVSIESINKHGEDVFKIPQNPAKKTNTCVLSKISDATNLSGPNSVPNLNIEESFAVLQVKNNDMYEKLVMRMDEWTCSYTQIMEDILNDVIQHTKFTKNILQYSVIDGLNVIKQCYKDQQEIRVVIEKLYHLILDCSCKKGQLKQSMKPEDYMKILSGSILLLQKLQCILPNYERLYESEGYLNRLADKIDDHELDQEFDLIKAASSSEFEDTSNRINFVKDKSYVINYLRKHNKEWALNYDSQENCSKDVIQSDTQDLKIIRTTGKNLNKFKIDTNKSIHCLNEDEMAGPKEMDFDPHVNENIQAGPKLMDLEGLDSKAEKAGPKMIRNLKPIHKYEEKIRSKSTKYDNRYLDKILHNFDTNLLKFNNNNSENTGQKAIENRISGILPTNNNKNYNHNYHNDNHHYHNHNGNSKMEIIEDSDDSGFENENTHAHSVVKIFLTELSTSFKVTYDFIDQFVKDVRRKTLSDRRMKIIVDKSTKALDNWGAIIPSLRSIISRESAEMTVLKGLLLKAGVEATSDKRIVKYRQIVMKSLEQAIVLEQALRILASISSDDVDSNMSLCTINYSGPKGYNSIEPPGTHPTLHRLASRDDLAVLGQALTSLPTRP